MSRENVLVWQKRKVYKHESGSRQQFVAAFINLIWQDRVMVIR